MKILVGLVAVGILLSGCAHPPKTAEISIQAVSLQKNEASHTSAVQMSGMSSRTFEEDQNCNGRGPMLVPLHPSAPIAAKIVNFVPPGVAKRLILRSEHQANGQIEPRYTDNLRVLIHPDGYPPYRHVTVLVPKGMNVQLGEQVTFIGGHASPQTACHYIPNLITGL